MARRSASDAATELRRLEDQRDAADQARQALVARRGHALLKGAPEDVVEVDRLRSVELARIEAAEVRIEQLRPLIEAEAREAAEAARVEAYRAAERVREDGVQALSDIGEHLVFVRSATARLVNAKAVVAATNMNLPDGYRLLPDPEPSADRGFSILDTMRIPLEAR